METIPVLWLDACRDWVLGVLRRNGLAEGDGNEQAGGSAFGVDGWINGAGLNPVLAEGGDVLLQSVRSLPCSGGVIGRSAVGGTSIFYVERTSSHHART